MVVSIDEVAQRASVSAETSVRYLEDEPTDRRPELLASRAGDLLRLAPNEDGVSVIQVIAKTMPSLSDPDVARRARQALRDKVINCGWRRESYGMSRSELDGVGLLRFVPDELRSLVEESFVTVSYAFGEVVVREGDPADAVYVIASGQARVVALRRQRRRGPPEHLGAGRLLRGDRSDRRPCRAQCDRPSVRRTRGPTA